jgi:hypothetical protein
MQIEALPFTYLGLPLGTTRPSVDDLMPLVSRLDKRLSGISSIMTYTGRLTLLNTTLRPSSFGLIEQLQGAKPLKPKRTLRLQPSFFLPRSRLSVYFQKLIKGGFSVASRASPAGIKPVQRVAPSFVRNYSRLPLGGRPGKRKKSQNVILSCWPASPSRSPNRARIGRLPTAAGSAPPPPTQLPRSAASYPPRAAARPSSPLARPSSCLPKSAPNPACAPELCPPPPKSALAESISSPTSATSPTSAELKLELFLYKRRDLSLLSWNPK